MDKHNGNDTPALFCKPQAYQNSLFKQYFGYNLVELRSLDIARDIDLIHEWVHSAHALPYWQLNVTVGELYTIYVSILQSPSTHSFIGIYNGKPVCQVDVYLASIDELHKHIDLKPDDCGMHFIMAPAEVGIKGLSTLMFNAFLLYYFSFDAAKRMYGEPDSNNEKANKLVRRSGFQFLKEIEMSYKQANLYVLLKERFICQFNEEQLSSLNTSFRSTN